MTNRYSHKFNAFIDGLYICELCDTDDAREFAECIAEFGNSRGFVAFIDGERVDASAVNIDRA